VDVWPAVFSNTNHSDFDIECETRKMENGIGGQLVLAETALLKAYECGTFRSGSNSDRCFREGLRAITEAATSADQPLAF
jgi:hypothetical protein